MMHRIRTAVARAIPVVTLAHVALYFGAGWVARTFLARRTLDGERQTPEQWAALLRPMIGRSSLALGAALGIALILLSVRATRTELAALFTRRTGPLNLAVFRVVCFGSFLVVFDARELRFFANLPPSLVQGLTDPLPLWRLLVPSPALASVLVPVFFGACFLACIGLFTRPAAIIACASGFYVLGLRQMFGKVDHDHHMLWFALILALSPSGAALSVDALLRAGARPAPRPGEAPWQPARSAAYALPLTMIWMLIGEMYFWPGFWKLVQHGPAWVLSDNFENHLYLKWFEDPTFTPIFRIDRHPWLCHAAALAALTWEMGFVFLVPFKRTRPWALAFGLAFHNATYLLMNIAFLSLQIDYLVFVDWERVSAWLERRGLWRVRQLRRALALRAEGAVRRARLALLLRPEISERTALRRTLVAGLGLLAINMAYGAAHHTDAWPFACYPTFSSLIKRERRSLYVEVEAAGDGAARPARTTGLLEAFRSERYAAVVRGIVAEQDEGRRRDKLSALADLVRKLDPTVQAGETIVIEEGLFSIDPDAPRTPRDPVRRYAVRVGEEAGAVGR